MFSYSYIKYLLFFSSSLFFFPWVKPWVVVGYTVFVGINTTITYIYIYIYIFFPKKGGKRKSGE